MIPHFPLTDQPFKAQMGLKLLDLKDWLEMGEDRAEQLEEKARLLRENRDAVLQVHDEEIARPAALELHKVVWEHLRQYHADLSLPTQGSPQSASDALADLARVVQEDFCLLSPRDQTLQAALVCFPSRWKLAEKMGRDSFGVHQNVSHFQSIARPTSLALAQLSKPLVRFNWTIHDSNELFAPEGKPGQELNPDEVLDNTYFRVERQTLRRLPDSQAVAFSIRTYVHSMREVVHNKERCRILSATLASLPIEVARYRGMASFLESLKLALGIA